MPRTERIEEPFADPTLNLALDTLRREKQALIFCSTKRGAESQAERIAAKHSPKEKALLLKLSERILSAVNSPTKQCKRLAACVKKGIAFHHSGLHGKQRSLIEQEFLSGTIMIICSTPTLAWGLDLPAFRSIVRDMKRFSRGTSWGMSDLPVLDVHQMWGRAGRPGKEEFGEGIAIASTPAERELIIEKYVLGEPEEIYSKLAVEPVLRTYVLSLIASGYVHDRESLYAFFGETFYAFQYGERHRLQAILDKMARLLCEWGFIEAPALLQGDFAVASEVAGGSLRPTRLGERVAQLYLDPLTAHQMLEALGRRPQFTDFSLLHLLASTLEVRPLPSVRQKEVEGMDRLLIEHEESLLIVPPGMYSHEYEEFLKSVKLARVFEEWVNEQGEDHLLEEYHVTPGDLHAKREIADWLLYSLVELSKLRGQHALISLFERMRLRLQHGVKEEVLPLLRLKNIGRVRARKLFANRIRSIEDVKKAEYSALKEMLGPALAADVKEQVGEKVRPEDVKVKPRKRKGQVSLEDFSQG